MPPASPFPRFLCGVCLAALLLTTADAQPLSFRPVGSFAAGEVLLGDVDIDVFDDSAAEIVAFDADTNQLFVVNGAIGGIDVLDISNPSAPVLADQVLLGGFGGVQSVAASNGVVAVALSNGISTNNGFVGLIDIPTLSLQNVVGVGALPDSLAFTPDGNRIVVANEGEATPGDEGEVVLPGVIPGPGQTVSVNPDGTISVIDLSSGIGAAAVSTLDFSAFAADLSSDNSPLNSVRINPIAEANFGVLSDLEPEFVTIAADGNTAYVSLQENNAIAVVDLSNPGAEAITELIPLGAIDFNAPGNGLDGRDNDGIAVIENQPVFGLFQPDGITTFESNGETFIVTANEGDNRADDDFGGVFQDFDDLDQLNVDPNFNGFTPGELATFLDNDTGIGDLEISSIDGDTDGDGDLDQLFAFGTRSFSIFDTDGNLVFDSGNQFESTIAQLIDDGELPPSAFGTDNDSNSAGENRSDDSGPEPEGVVVSEVGGRTLAFIGIERTGGFFVYDITDPENVEFVDYVNPRDFELFLAEDLDDDALVDAADADLEGAVNALSGALDPSQIGLLDLGPEGLTFISADDSPNGLPLLVITNEVSGTTTIFALVPEPTTGLLGLAACGLVALRRRVR